MLLDSLKLKIVLSLIPTLVVLCACGEKQANQKSKASEATYREKYAEAKALFEERCKSAGTVIKRTVKDVEGIELTKIRQPIPWGGNEYFDQMYPEAAMAGEYRGDQYIIQFLMTESIDQRDRDRRGSLNPPDFDAGPETSLRRGYRFVEFTDPASGKRLRAELDTYPQGTNLWVKPPKLLPVASAAVRYAVEFEDTVDPADRALWIAGTKVRITDKETGEVLAQLTRFVWDQGFGSSSSGRWPWSYAATLGSSQCPNLRGVQNDISRKFVDTVLIPKQDD